MAEEYSFEDLRLMDIEHLKKLSKAVKESKMNDINEKIFFFFNYALLPYYEDVFWDGLANDAGHIIYRLSDILPKEERQNMIIYPSDNGSIIMNNSAWDSLEDWRKKWEKIHNGNIPDFTRRLPSSMLELFVIK